MTAGTPPVTVTAFGVSSLLRHRTHRGERMGAQLRRVRMRLATVVVIGVPAARPGYWALNSVGLFSHDSVENLHSWLGGRRTLPSAPWLAASTTESGASRR